MILLRLDEINLDPLLDRFNTASVGLRSADADSVMAVLAGYTEEEDRLRESLREVGMREPLLVRREGDRYLLVDGYRRYYQLRYLAERNELGSHIDAGAIPCLDVSELPVATAKLRLESNERRQDLPPCLQAEKFRTLMHDHGRTIAQIATMFALSAPSISNYLILLKCVPEVRRAIDNGDLPMSAGKVFGILTEEGQRKLWKKVAGARGVTRRRLWELAKRMPDKFFLQPKHKRMQRSESIRRAKRGQKQERGKTRTYLQGDLSSLVGEVEYKEQILNDTRAKLLSLVRWWLTALRNPQFMSFMAERYPEKLSDIELILEVEANYRREGAR
ncbi:MAG: ParB/RepB/Spo0J family partition protein [candidate division WOR-3 bacterium]